MLDILLDVLKDSLRLLPFLFFAFLIIELLEHKFNKYTKKVTKNSGKFGPIIGSVLGLFPQCGFSVMATNLYVTRLITLGTLISIYLATSDEMLPILLSQSVAPSEIIKILSIKFLIALITGIIIDLLFKSTIEHKKHYDICNKEHCHCKEDGVIKSTIHHTLKIWIFIFICLLGIESLIEFMPEGTINNIFKSMGIFSPFIASLIGLIPSCGASVIITELYLNSMITLSSLISGLLTGSGVALIVLFRENDNIKNSFKILLILYTVGAVSGLIIELIEHIV